MKSSTGNVTKRLLSIGLVSGSLFVPFSPAADTKSDLPGPVVSRDFWTPDAAVWGDGREKFPASRQHLPQGFRTDYVIEAPATGWYELTFAGAGEGFRNDVFVDGQPQWRYAATDKNSKAGNLWLEKGQHTLRVQRLGRVGYPLRAFDRVELRASDGRPEASIQARKTLVDVVRQGEIFQIQITGGGSNQAARYELYRTNLTGRDRTPELAATVEFGASDKPQTKTIDILCPAEGAFSLTARANEKPLTSADFQIGQYAVVDVKHPNIGDGKTELVADIDCVAQTLNGSPLPAEAFTECNGPTRITRSEAGQYREGHDCTPPQAPVPPTAVQEPVSFSGFSYRVPLDRTQVPYLVDVEYPDDARRSVTISLNQLDPQTGQPVKGSGYNGKSYETGGTFPLTKKMVHHRAIFWAKTPSLLVGVLSQSPGYRAAVTRIRISRFVDGKLPQAFQLQSGGRSFVHWYEEARSWKFLTNVDAPDGIVHDFIGLDRWAQLARYYGANGISALGIGYQDAFFRTTTLDGMLPGEYDSARLLCLICEKYGMRYMPEAYYAQWYLESRTFPEQVGNDDDFRAISANGGRMGSGASPCTVNPLHPIVQQTWINALGELADKLRDSPAFTGITVRCDAWGFRGEFLFPSLYWGYGDWTTNAFQHDTGIAIPGDAEATAAKLPQRFLNRFQFLTSDAVKPKWIAWRNGRMLDYHQRILNRIRGDRKDIFFGIAGAFDADPTYKLGDTLDERALGAGVDIAQRQKIDGLPIIPVARYGSRNATATDRAIYDGFFDKELIDSGMANPRAFSAYMNYLELATYWPAEKLGIKFPPNAKPFYYCSAALGAGRHSLEKFAVVLAEQDTSVMRDGGNVDIYGDPAIWGPWFGEYEALPALPFQPFAGATDPVAVWSRDVSAEDAGKISRKPGFYFYAVNREQYPVTLTLAFNNAAPLTALRTGELLPADGKLVLTLAAYELRSFSAPAGTTIVSANTEVPPERVEAVRKLLAFSQNLLTQFDGPLAGTLTAEELQAFRTNVAVAWNALEAGHLWRARVTLQSAAMMKAFTKAGHMPEGEVVTHFPNLMRPVAKAGHWNLTEPMLTAEQLTVRGADDKPLTPIDSSSLNADWGGAKVQYTDGNRLSIDLDAPADGEYTLQLGHIESGPGVGLAQIDGKPLAVPIETRIPATPDTTVFPPVRLTEGKHTLTLNRPGGIGVYGLKFLPKLRPMPDAIWAVAGPFPSMAEGGAEISDAVAKATFAHVYPPEKSADIRDVYHTDDGREIRWGLPTSTVQGALWDRGVDMPIRAFTSHAELSFGLTHIHSDRPRKALLYIAIEWWGQAFVNGQRVETDIDPKLKESCGADFMTSYPTFRAVVSLKQGDNTLLIKQLGGSLGSAFAAFITDDDGITLSLPTPTKESRPSHRE